MTDKTRIVDGYLNTLRCIHSPPDAMTQAEMMKELMDTYRWSGAELARQIGCSKGAVSQAMTILEKLTPKAKEAVKKMHITSIFNVYSVTLLKPDEQDTWAEQKEKEAEKP